MMENKIRKSFFPVLMVAAALFLSDSAFAQRVGSFDHLLNQIEMEEDLSFVASDLAAGRESGTPGKQAVEQFIVRRFRNLGLKPYHWCYTESVPYNDSIVLRNVVGYLPAVAPSNEYIIVGAHYDHVGTLAGRIYPGADDNASGVSALLGLAKLFATLKAEGKGPAKNIIFVAFDGKELSMSGSEHFVKNLDIPRGSIVCALNIDMLGTNLVPVGVNSNYIIALGENTVEEKYRGYLKYLTRNVKYKMDLDLTFYGSRNFTDIVYKTGDQYPFAKAGIPSMLFTSAFHDHTYKPTDTKEIINFPLLRRRTLVIFNFLLRLCE